MKNFISNLSTKNLVVYIGLVIILAIGLATNYHRLIKQARNHAINALETTYGSQPLDSQSAAFILAIANEMGITENIKICKMNTQAMRQFGYGNAFAATPAFLNFIPISDQPYMFISESFFADLSLAEQRFLIGHELIHIRDRHVNWLNFWTLALQILLLIITWRLIKPLRLKLRVFYAQALYKQFIITLITCYIIFNAIGLIPRLANLTYRRYIERAADCSSLQLLNSHEGALKFMNRIEKDYRQPKHNPYFGLFSDHPACHERRIYCLESQLQNS